MRLTYNWLKEYVDFDLSVEELADRLDLSGTEVESLVHLGDGLDRVVVGKIKRIEPHPNADRLTLCLVETAPGQTAEIVCGAMNINVGDIVPVALPGAELPNGLKIRESVIRGVKSHGMMCSAEELLLGKNAEGILILPQTAKIGTPIDKALELDDWLIEVEVTPNRPDCLGVIGLAREVAALTGGKLRLPPVKMAEGNDKISEKIDVEIKDPDLCSRYVARLFKNLTVGPSPLWLSRRLDIIGIRSINNVVDITNYVLMETGQPLHAFDIAMIKGDRIIVRRAKPREILVTIDHVTRRLEKDMLVIADEKHPLALAGVMGGFDSEISEKTTEVLLESAGFDPVNIMRTSRSLGLISESSYRFEKGVDAAGCLFAADRAAQLIKELAGAEVYKGAVDNYPVKRQVNKVKLRPARVNQVLGADLDQKKMTGILKSLDLEVSKGKKAGEYSVAVPTFRRDLEREIDLVEEIARLYGLNNLGSTLPLSTDEERGLTPDQRRRRFLRGALQAAGLSETVTYSFMDGRDLDNLNLPDDHWWRQAPALANPIAEDQSLLRTSLLPNLLKTVRHNLNRGQNEVQVFEIGTVFLKANGASPKENLELGIALSGGKRSPQWYEEPGIVDFFDLKGLAEMIAEKMNLADHGFRTAAHPSFHPGTTAELISKNDVIGIFGQIHPDVAAAFEIKQNVFALQLDINSLLNNIETEKGIAEIPRFPGLELDMALVVDERIANSQIEQLIRKNGSPLLKEVSLFDLYRGANLPDGKKSLAYALTYRSDKRTLTDNEVQKIHERIIRKAEQELGATLR